MLVFVRIGNTLSKCGFKVSLKSARIIRESQEYLLCNHVQSSLDGEGYRDINVQLGELGLPNMSEVVSMSCAALSRTLMAMAIRCGTSNTNEGIRT